MKTRSQKPPGEPGEPLYSSKNCVAGAILCASGATFAWQAQHFDCLLTSIGITTNICGRLSVDVYGHTFLHTCLPSWLLVVLVIVEQMLYELIAIQTWPVGVTSRRSERIQKQYFLTLVVRSPAKSGSSGSSEKLGGLFFFGLFYFGLFYDSAVSCSTVSFHR